MSTSIVTTAYGKVQGTIENGVYVWKGIPYAKAPVGKLRFQPPQPPEKWNDIKDCTKFGPIAYQPELQIMQFLGTPTDNMSEDCLNLNIWSPNPDEKKRPVMVWIHGGAYISGSGSSPSYDGTEFAKNGDVVVVTINYRLGIFGFLHLAEIGGEKYQASGNCGLLDQIAALKWIKENIEAFGGDPNRVTVFGESAGAMSIGTLLAMPSAKGLFQQAILQSGAASHVVKSEVATKNAERLLRVLNISKDNLEKLEELPAEQLVEAVKQLPMMTLIPVIDGVYLPKHPKTAIAEGITKDVTILIGTNKDEYKLFTVLDPTWKNASQDAIENIFKRTFRRNWEKMSKHFKKEALNRDLYERLMNIFSFTNPAVYLADEQSKNGGTVYMYRFDWESKAFGGALKACHALEIPFVWNTLHKENVHLFTGESPDLDQLAKQMHQAWIAFAHHGDPNHALLPNWPKYTAEQQATLLFNTETTVVNAPHKEDCQFWDSLQKVPEQK